MAKDRQNQEGVSLIITFFIMVIILSVVLSISVLLYNEVKVIRNIGNSIVSFYAADSGIEKVLFYDRQVLPLSNYGETAVKRGLCSMLSQNNPDGSFSNQYCSEADSPLVDSNISGMYCNSPVIDANCNPNDCTDCSISFNTTLGGGSYSVVAKIHPSDDGKFSNLEIDSRGNFGGAVRKIQIQSQEIATVATTPPPAQIGYSVLGAGTDVVNGDYYVYGNTDGVTSYKKADDSSYMYRYFVAGMFHQWKIGTTYEGVSGLYIQGGTTTYATPDLASYTLDSGGYPPMPIVTAVQR